MNQRCYSLARSVEMEALGHKIARQAQRDSEAALIVYLQGPLGAGKTTWVRGFLRAFGFNQGVKSPTYTLVEPYELETRNIYHFDFYRLHSEEELEYLGIRDYFEAGNYCLVEWPNKVRILPTPDLELIIKIGNRAREVMVNAHTLRGQYVLSAIE